MAFKYGGTRPSTPRRPASGGVGASIADGLALGAASVFSRKRRKKGSSSKKGAAKKTGAKKATGSKAAARSKG